MIKNPKYLPNKKNNNNPPEITDERVKYVPVGCGNCMECRKQKRNIKASAVWSDQVQVHITVNEELS